MTYASMDISKSAEVIIKYDDGRVVKLMTSSIKVEAINLYMSGLRSITSDDPHGRSIDYDFTIRTNKWELFHPTETGDDEPSPESLW